MQKDWCGFTVRRYKFNHLAINASTAVAGKAGFTLASAASAATAVVEFKAKFSNLCLLTVLQHRSSHDNSWLEYSILVLGQVKTNWYIGQLGMCFSFCYCLDDVFSSAVVTIWMMVVFYDFIMDTNRTCNRFKQSIVNFSCPSISFSYSKLC